MEKETEKDGIEIDRFMELMKMCNDADNPNPKARQDMQQLIRGNPLYTEWLQKQESIYSVALRNRIENLKSSDTFKEISYVKCRQLRDDLGYQTANPLEKLAIEQIVLCWYNHYKTELLHSSIVYQPHSNETGLYWEKRLAYSSRRYERALELLSKMRKMNLVVQVNNATNQIVNPGK